MSQAAPRSRPGQQAHPGNVTGRKVEQLAREHSEEIAAREGEISLINAERARSIDDDVIDPETREVINTVDGSVRSTDEPVDDAPRILGAGDSVVEELVDRRVAPVDAGPLLALNQSQDYLMEKVVVRVNCDLEDVTLGYGNHVTFLEGRRYRVPRWVAHHLEEKGVVWAR